MWSAGGWVGPAVLWCPPHSLTGSAWLFPGLRGAHCVQTDAVSIVKSFKFYPWEWLLT